MTIPGTTIPGITIALGGRDWTVPPLTLGQLRRLLPKVQRLATVSGVMDAAQIDILVEIVVAALSRNYPDTMPEEVAEMLDLGNAQAVLTAILTGSGLERSRAGEVPPGEPAAVASPTGPTSTAPSPPPAATAFPSSTP